MDARKKSQQANGHATSPDELRLEDHSHVAGEPSSASDQTRSAENTARSTGQNLFNAKSPPSPAGHTLPNRNLLFALGGTILLLAIGGGYLWYLDSASGTALLRPMPAPPASPAQSIVQALPAAIAEPAPQSALVPGIAVPDAAKEIQLSDKPALNEAEGLRTNDQITPMPAASAPAGMPQTRSRRPDATPVSVEQRSTEPLIDPLLNAAYLAYQNDKLDEAQSLYLSLFRKNAQNMDALLGLAAIAQQRGENRMAAQYYKQALALDPRNAFAHAGMSALSTDQNNESRLKTLLREQGNSAALHFALGNLYADQSRWGEAQQAYFNAYTLESTNAEFAFNLAVSLDHLGQGRLAAQHYQRALQLDSSRSAGFDHAQISQRVQELTR